jgi:hypothetical protein
VTFRSPEELEAADTVGWIIDGLQGFAANVGSLVPGGFAAYARVLHPAQHDTEAVSWSAVAAANGSVLHAEAQFGKLVGNAPIAVVSSRGMERPRWKGACPDSRYNSCWGASQAYSHGGTLLVCSVGWLRMFR